MPTRKCEKIRTQRGITHSQASCYWGGGGIWAVQSGDVGQGGQRSKNWVARKRKDRERTREETKKGKHDGTIVPFQPEKEVCAAEGNSD